MDDIQSQDYTFWHLVDLVSSHIYNFGNPDIDELTFAVNIKILIVHSPHPNHNPFLLHIERIFCCCNQIHLQKYLNIFDFIPKTLFHWDSMGFIRIEYSSALQTLEN